MFVRRGRRGRRGAGGAGVCDDVPAADGGDGDEANVLGGEAEGEDVGGKLLADGAEALVGLTRGVCDGGGGGGGGGGCECGGRNLRGRGGRGRRRVWRLRRRRQRRLSVAHARRLCSAPEVVELVHSDDQRPHPERLRYGNVLFRLPALEPILKSIGHGVNHYNGQIRLGSAGNHPFNKIFMAGGIN